MNEVKIEIAAATNSGKSTIVYLLEQVLLEHGINYTYKIGDMELVERSDSFDNNQEKRLAYLKDNLKVEISTKQISRTALSTTK